MKYIRGIKIGGLQQKIFNLVLIFILALVGAYAAVSLYHQKNLAEIVQKASSEQQDAISTISQNTMTAVLETSMVRATALQAYIANDLFSDVQTDVLTLQAFATELFAHKDQFHPHPFYEPDPAKAGIATVQMQHELGVDPADSEALGMAANMSEIMLAMFESSGKLNSCFVATADGCILFVDDRSDAYVDENGAVQPFAVRERPWYLQAVEAGELIFTGVELDAFTDVPGLVCAAPVYLDGELAAVVGADIFLTSISDYVRDTATDGGFLCVVDENGQVLFSPAETGIFKAELSEQAADLRSVENRDLADFVTKALRERTSLTQLEIDGREYYLVGAPMETLGWTVLSVVEKEITEQPTKALLGQFESINKASLAEYEKGAANSTRTVLVLTAVIVLLALTSALMLASRVVKPLERMTQKIQALGSDNLQFTMEDSFRTKDEIEILAENFAMLSGKTVRYLQEVERITAEKERIGTELALATRIQADMLPNIYPAFPDRPEFDIYASMDPAKEVGGDFYDFFLVDEDHLCMVIADVSGKGVPAALFMMASKIILASQAKQGKTPAQILTDANAAICSNNREQMFVTVWLGILELSTGRLTAANAGHEFPAILQPDGSFVLYKDKHGFVIGGMDGIRYKEYELRMEPGAKLFLYTDGVPEATNADNTLFGTVRMLEALNEAPEASPQQILKNVRAAVDAFVQDAEQFDDLTMLCIEYQGRQQPDATNTSMA
ncbi:MAG: SpoIIE family protein phosphatase [Oscillospiraceae bacterium]|nr:SpoIIE family protein phosphatase [Oscillospiraceae bacterium]